MKCSLVLAAALAASPMWSSPADPVPAAASPASATPLLVAGRAAYQAGRFEEAEAAWLAATRLAPRLPAAWLALGLARLALRRYGLAAEAFKAAHLLAPEDVQALYHLGLAHSLAGEDGLALPPYQRASELAPQDGRVWNNLGEAYLQLGRVKEARASFEAATRLLPGRAEAWHNLELAAQQQGDDRRAAEARQRGRALAPPPSPAPTPGPPSQAAASARTLAVTGHLPQALATLRAALLLAPRDAEAFGALAELLALSQRGDPGRDLDPRVKAPGPTPRASGGAPGASVDAEALARKALALAPASAAAHASLGVVLVAAHRLEPARLAFRDALALGGSPVALRGLAVVAAMQGDRPGTRTALAAYRTAAPSELLDPALMAIWALEDGHPDQARAALRRYLAGAAMHPASRALAALSPASSRTERQTLLVWLLLEEALAR